MSDWEKLRWFLPVCAIGLPILWVLARILRAALDARAKDE